MKKNIKNYIYVFTTSNYFAIKTSKAGKTNFPKFYCFFPATYLSISPHFYHKYLH